MEIHPQKTMHGIFINKLWLPVGTVSIHTKYVPLMLTYMDVSPN